MRKLKLQMQITIDGFVMGPNGEMDWMWLHSTPDKQMFDKVIQIADESDTILLGRKMTQGFVDHWENILDNQPESPEHPLAQRMVELNKIAFTQTQAAPAGRNLMVENGNLSAAIHALKQQPGKDLLAYGGASFAQSLIQLNLVDEYYLFVNPVAIGAGISIFNQQKVLNLQSTTAYNHGKLLNVYTISK